MDEISSLLFLRPEIHRVKIIFPGPFFVCRIKKLTHIGSSLLGIHQEKQLCFMI